MDVIPYVRFEESYDPFDSDVFKNNLIDKVFKSHKLNDINQVSTNLIPLLAAELIEGDSDYHLHVDLPGVDPDDLDCTIHSENKPTVLVIKAKREHYHDKDMEGNYLHVNKIFSERTFGKVQRTINLPDNIDIDKCESNFKNGVLHIRIPKTNNGKQIFIY